MTGEGAESSESDSSSFGIWTSADLAWFNSESALSFDMNALWSEMLLCMWSASLRDSWSEPRWSSTAVRKSRSIEGSVDCGKDEIITGIGAGCDDLSSSAVTNLPSPIAMVIAR